MLKLVPMALVVAAVAFPTAANADVVTSWDRPMVDAIDTAHTAPPPAMRAAAIVQSAVFDAVNGIARRYTAVHVQPAAPRGASREAAAASAAHETLVALFPQQQATLDAKLAETLAQLDDNSDGGGRSVARGIEWWQTVADAILAWRGLAGFSSVLPPYAPVSVPGRWQPAPPAFAGPLFREFATMTPFALTSPSQFLPAAPPPLGSARYAADFNEVKAIGSATSATRTAEQAQTALFWAGDPPAAIWNRAADDLAERADVSLLTNARRLALVNIALIDAVISIWNAKNAFDTWRPITAIRQAATDGNDETSADPSWTPLLATPPFQEYPAGHPGVSNAAASVLASIYGDDTAFTLTSAGLPGVQRSFTSFSSAVAQVGDARVWGGIHFRFACDAAVGMGAAVARFVTANELVRIRGEGDD